MDESCMEGCRVSFGLRRVLISSATGAPAPIQIVLDGGLSALLHLIESINADRPVLVLQETGRVADALAYAWRFLHDESEAAQELTFSGIRTLVQKVIDDPDCAVPVLCLCCACAVTVL